jgi:hypothetical protein
MKDGWKGFWWGLGAAILAGIGYLLFKSGGIGRNPQGDGGVPTPQDVKKEASRIREKIKKESDQALADRFNRLAKGKKEKSG